MAAVGAFPVLAAPIRPTEPAAEAAEPAHGPACPSGICRTGARVPATVKGDSAHDGGKRNAPVSPAARLGQSRPAFRAEIMGAVPARFLASFDPPLPRPRR